MTALSSYSIGTISVAANGTVVTGVGTIWSETSVRPGDILQVGSFQTVIIDVTDPTHLVIPPWGGGAQAGVAYVVWKVSLQRIVGAQAQQSVSDLIAALDTDALEWILPANLVDPTGYVAEDDQYIRQPSTGKLWVMQGGAWVYLGVYSGLKPRGPYDNAAVYSTNDYMSFGGSTYIWINDAPGSGHAPPNATYWDVLAGKGDAATVAVGATTTGAAGSSASVTNSGTSGAAVLDFTIPRGSGYGGTSTTSLTIGAGAQAFTTQSGLAYQNGVRVRASSNAAPTNWMEGIATYSGTTLTIAVDNSSGAGTFADWNLNVVGERGQPGTVLSADEYKYWLGMAAMLDPAAYVLYTGKFSLTVPAGETLYVLNAWSTVIAGGTSSWFHRDLASSEAFEVSAGTTISWDGISYTAFLYVCRPALVMNDSKYADPKALYFQRLNALRGISLSQISATTPSGSAPGTLARTLFPSDFSDGIFAQVSVMDAPWCILMDALLWGASNTTNEISDAHQYRITKTLLTAFVRETMPYIEVQSANISGNGTDVSTFVSRGVMAYYKLPGTWRATPSRAYKAAVLADSPSRYFTFDERAGATAANLGSATSADAAYVGSFGYAMGGATGDGSTSVAMNSADDYVSLPGSADWNLAGSDFTFEFWVRFDALPASSASYDPWVVNGWVTSNGDTDNSFLVAVQNNKLAVLVKYADATTGTVSSTISLATDTFYHVIVGRSSGTLFIRVVGKEARQTVAVSKNLITRNSKVTMLGNSFSGGASPGTFRMTGRLDEFAFYKAALSDARADAHHAATLGWV